MTYGSGARAPRIPTLPQGEQIASYATYLEAQKAVDHLSDKAFPVQHVTIVGADLRMVERVTGRLSYSRVAGAGAASGAWFGLFVGLLLTIFSEGNALPIISAVLIGAAFGMLFSVSSYALSRGRRDFTSSSQIVAASYSVLCDMEHVGKARSLLGELGAVRADGAARPVSADVPPTPPVPPTQPGPPA